ncbi:ATP-binding protein [Arcobacter cryaerophilus gv. pseudocryaerophilus]|uniref:ATP-binding protein n=3 Tax=unclassified Arcobacter TaxID=2593671 RepID=A0AA96DHY4_9BACT|nr:ATP-binding protein [Arcobacter sp. AZ-2023]WPD06339.1 ATP-binding protein [Arcobacter sp. DSM 115956]WPD08430.1 ATP-binding protein [Arcobacter sp. DSM 115955]WNL32695.1 ATP-binding protein [Arcobacter sp. AZ-2023]WNP38845.1 ATP-binding protein [Arcobacter sp. AZ-2023]
MKLQFLKPYPNSSITKKFDDIELNDFTVITGKNGVGKTHFLEAMVHNQNYINIEGNSNVIYFNYNDFIIDNTNNNKKILKKRNSNSNQIAHDINEIRNKVNSKIFSPFYRFFDDKTTLAQNFYTYLTGKISYLYIPSWENCRDEILAISSDEDTLQRMYNKLKELIDVFLQTEDQKFHNYINKAQSLNISFSGLTASHFEYQESWLGQLLENEFKEYIKKYDKVKKDIEAKSSDESTIAEIKKKTIDIVGIPPWNLLNDILKTYDCNGYLIDEELINKLESFINLQQHSLNIKLKNYKNNKEISLDRLSSGEKTLFALAVALYRQEKDKNLPTVILLDEIDSSLHPSMCKQLLSVLENIFVKKYELKIIMVTHSPSTVALSPDNSIYIMENNDGKISLENKPKEEAIKFLSDGFATYNDGLSFLDKLLNNKKISILTEGKNTKYIEQAIKLIEPSLLDSIEIVKGAEEKTGKSQLKTLFDFVSRIQHNQIIFFVWDSDCEEYKKLKQINKVIPFIFDKNNKNNIAKKGIENLFEEVLFKGFYTEIKKSDGLINKNFEENKKNDFFDLIEKRSKKEDFKNFKPLIDKLKSL